MRHTGARTCASGALAGAFATLFHTAAMLAARACLPRARRRPVPPSQITWQIAGRSGVVRTDGGLTVATAVAHFGYGTLAGAAYTLLPHQPRGPALARGIAYGIGVWAVSYQGWLPALGILPPASRLPAQRNAMMLLAHVAWGAAFGAAFERLGRTGPARDTRPPG